MRLRCLRVLRAHLNLSQIVHVLLRVRKEHTTFRYAKSAIQMNAFAPLLCLSICRDIETISSSSSGQVVSSITILRAATICFLQRNFTRSGHYLTIGISKNIAQLQREPSKMNDLVRLDLMTKTKKLIAQESNSRLSKRT